MKSSDIISFCLEFESNEMEILSILISFGKLLISFSSTAIMSSCQKKKILIGFELFSGNFRQYELGQI